MLELGVNTPEGKCSMLFFTYYAPDAGGPICPMIFLLGNPCILSSCDGETTEPSLN
jgi:hypothetical protein